MSVSLLLQFTALKYDHIIEPAKEATFEYSFFTSETFNARPFGLTINLNYKDAVSVFDILCGIYSS